MTPSFLAFYLFLQEPPAAKGPHPFLQVPGGRLYVRSVQFLHLSERTRLSPHATALPLLSLHLQNGNSTKGGGVSAIAALRS